MAEYELRKPVFLIGFMGAGKTSVASRIAQTCQVAVVDLDAWIEEQAGMSVSDIFAQSGEGHFRELEGAALAELSAGSPCLVSCGGGIVTRPQNREILRSAGLAVYLQAPFDVARKRVEGTATRPLFEDIAQARRLYDTRAALYEEAAEITIDTTGKSVGEVACEAIDALLMEGALWQQQE